MVVSLPTNNSPYANTPFSPSGQAGVRSPVAQASINGIIITGLEEMEVSNNSHFAADTFHAHFALGALPLAFGLAFWDAAQSGIQISLSAGVATNGVENFIPLILGQVDDIDIDLANQRLTISGRDLAAAFLDNKTAETFSEQTSSKIVKILAKRRGLQANVKETHVRVGSYNELQTVTLNTDMTEWDLLTKLAQLENFDLWVSGNTLNFQPRLETSGQPYVLVWDSLQKKGNFVDLKLKRAMTLASDVIVQVQSWNQAGGVAFTKTAKISKSSKKANKGNSTGGQPQTYIFRRANLTAAQAQQLANSLAEDISRHERNISVKLPGDTILNTRTIMQLTGTGTGFDTMYFPDKVTRRISVHDGFVMDVTAKNHSPQEIIAS